MSGGAQTADRANARGIGLAPEHAATMTAGTVVGEMNDRRSSPFHARYKGEGGRFRTCQQRSAKAKKRRSLIRT